LDWGLDPEKIKLLRTRSVASKVQRVDAVKYDMEVAAVEGVHILRVPEEGGATQKKPYELYD
jgi:hypothetical protein